MVEITFAMFAKTLFVYSCAFAFGFIYRYVLRIMAKKFSSGKHSTWGIRHQQHNIGYPDRLLRFGIGIALLIWGYESDFNSFLFFASGFCFFEALFSWCGFYALLGKSSCPI